MDLILCRICCKSEGTISIFNENKEPKLSAQIMYCCPKVSVYESDGLPSLICSVCEEELAVSYQFILKCEASDVQLRAAIVLDNVIDADCDKLKVEVKTELNHNSDLEDQFLDYYEPLDHVPLVKLKGEIKIEEYDGTKLKTRKSSKKRGKYKKVPLSCDVCGRSCPNQSALQTHMRSHTGERPYPCGQCDKSYKDLGTLKRHTLRNHCDDRERKFVCENCGKSFYSRNDVQIHMRIHTGETPYACSDCPMKFTQISSLIRHRRRHTGEKTHICSVCPKRFSTRDELKNHANVHSTKKRFTCSICSIPFKYANNLKKHLKIHSEPHRFVCNYCGRTFNQKGNLKNHINRQHSEKSGYCNICAKDISNMEVHMWRHTGQRPLKCELCSSSFYDLKCLARHVNYRHKNPDKYKCLMEGCRMTFPSRPMLDFHTAKLHGTGIPFPCDRCSRGFYRKSDLARHKLGTHKERLLE